jgi:hypothetical protein
MGETQANSEDGVVRDSHGRWIIAPKSPAPITHANARTLATTRWEMAREASIQGLMQGTLTAIPTDAIAKVVKAQTELAQDKAAGRASTEAARFSFQAAGIMNDSQNATDNDSITLTATGEAATRLIELISALRDDNE